jgi:hypothetical protein
MPMTDDANANPSDSPESDFHRRRAGAEMETALAGMLLPVALSSRARAASPTTFAALGPTEPPPPPRAFYFINGTDKKG